MLFYVVEIDAYQPGSNTRVYTKGWSTSPWATLSRHPNPAPSTTTIRASDSGYRTADGDPDGVQPYPAHLNEAFALDRICNMDPVGSGVSAAAGNMLLAGPPGAYDGAVAVLSVDGRAMRTYVGNKAYDPTRGYFVDPDKASLVPIFLGMANQWTMGDGVLTIPWRDPTYWLEQPVQTNVFTGAGGYNGTSDLAGTPLPKARGGTASNPIRNVTPVLIDPSTNTYMASDGHGQVVQVYEAGASVFAYQGDTANLFAGSTSAGNYRTDNSRTCFQLGSTPVGEITCDVVGEFPSAGAKYVCADIAYNLLVEDCAVPPANVDATAFSALAASLPYTAGVYFHPDDRETGVQALDRLLVGLGVKLAPLRNGKLSVFRPYAGMPAPTQSLTESTIIDVRADPLPPVPWRIAMVFKRNHTRQTSGVSASATASWRRFIGSPGSTVAWFSPAVAQNQARPRDLTIANGALLIQAHAQAVVNAMGAYYSGQRRSFWITLPIEVGLAVDIGQSVRIKYSRVGLVSPKVGWITGDRIRTTDGTMQIRVMV